MKLLRCHIDNFGKLTDYTVDFTENPQVFYAPNGWGKSTLAAFIKVMFYGFSGEGKRGATLDKERVRFKPWQGGVYGGELLFEAGGKRYLLNRTFGNKEAEDTFALYDAATNLKSGDYSDNIGEELFQINQESFLRTVFLGQNACDTAITDSINAKIGNLADNLDDINNYEKVQQVLKDLRNSMSPTRKTGSLKKQKENIAQLRDELRKAGAIETAVSELEEKLAVCEEEKKCLQTQRNTAQEQWEEMTRMQALAAAKAHYDSIVNQCNEKQKHAEEILISVGGVVPAKNRLSEAHKQLKLLQEKESAAQAHCLTEQEIRERDRLGERFAQSVPEERKLQQAREQLSHLEDLRLEAARRCLDESELSEKQRLEERLGVGDVSSEERKRRLEHLEDEVDEGLGCISNYLDQKNGLSAKKATLSSLKLLKQQENAQRQQRLQQLRERREMQRKVQGAAVAVLIAGFVFMVAGGILLALSNQITGIALLCAGAVATVLGGILTIVGRKRLAISTCEPDWAEAERTEGSEDCQALEQEIEQDEELMQANREAIAALLAEVEQTAVSDWLSESTWSDALCLRDKLYTYKEDIKNLQRLCARESDYQAKGYEQQITGLQKQLEEFLSAYCDKVRENGIGELLSELSRDLEQFVLLKDKEKRYNTAKQEAETHRQQIEELVSKHGRNTADLYESLPELSGLMNDYEKTCDELDRLKSDLQVFERNNDVSALAQAGAVQVGLDEELKVQMLKLDELLLQTDEQIHGYRRQLEDRQAEAEELSLHREALESAEADYEKDHVYYTRIGYVSEYLEKAKESLSARYIGPIQDSFRRNYQLLAGESAEDFRMDANIHVTKRDLGEQREKGAFSAGNQDLINIVLRLALVDAMYQKEKPFLVIDDSFVNLDGERLKFAGRFMKQIAKEYQVIYFTCHESRVWTE